MLQVEPANTAGDRDRRAAGTPVSRPQSRSSSRGLISPNYARSPQRFDLESELTFSPKLNNTSLKLVQDRRDQGLVQRSRLPRETRHSEFTFRPQMSTASLKIAEGLGTTFMARQEMHLEKQKKLLEQSKQPSLKGRLSPVTKNKKTKDKENADNLAWGTPTSTPNLTDKRASTQSLPENKDAGSNDFYHHPGISGSASILTPQLNPVRGGRTMPPMQSSIHLQRISDTTSPFAPGNSLLLKRQKSIIKDRSPRLHKRGITHPVEGGINDSGNDSDMPGHQRSRTYASPEPPSPRTRARIMAGQGPAPTGERLRLAKIIAEKALKKNKVFMIQGPYPVVRECLRRRDWVEKQYRAMAPHKVKKAKNDSDDDSDDDAGDPDDDNDNGCHGGSDVEEDNGLDDSDSVYGIMSRIVRNSTPSFIWTCRAGGIDYKFLKNNAHVNHFAKNSAFTTKVGLCTNIQSLSTFGTVEPDSFFPRCYKICSEEEKNAFVDDYRLTAASSIIKWVVQRHNGELDVPMEDNEDSDEEEEVEETTGEDNTPNTPRPKSTTSTPTTSPRKVPRAKKIKDKAILETSLIDKAIEIINHHFCILEHEDIDWPLDAPPIMSGEEWDLFIKQYYQLIYDGGIINGSASYVDQCSSILNRLRASKAQLDMEGLRNVWIVKPGAKSRGRGITCMNNLSEILKLVGSAIVQKEGKWVVQKYIERPLLIYNTKFDIRQWFLVTDWNPLTVWFYTSCYLRFCGHPFSLEKMDSAIHLSNQSVQKHFELCPTRSRMLPDDNMWTSEEFQQYLKKRGCGNVWYDVVCPGMKKAIIAALECCQDVVEPRKGSFELYGADFMLTEDFHPWLIEINSSPAMGATTEITEKMCYDVIEDTMKVVLDRKHDKNCDTGQFELIHKQSGVSAPQYIGQALSVEGSAVRKPLNRQKSSPNLVNVPRLSMTTAPARKQCGEPTRSKATMNRTEKMVAVSDDPSIARATNLEDMKKKLSVYNTRFTLQLRSSREGFKTRTVGSLRLPKIPESKRQKQCKR